MNPEKIRDDFSIFQNREDLSYLDNAATSQKPDQVVEAVKQFYLNDNANVGRGLYDLANDATQVYEDARRTVADFVGASKEEIIFVRSTTEAVNLLAYSLDFEGGIVLGETSHHSEQLPWRRKAWEEGRNVEYLGTENGKISVKDAEEKITEDTGLVAISHVSNVYGCENSAEEIVELADEHDALVVLDAAQSAPHIPIDVKDLGVDFMCFSGHKMLGPTGIGVLYGRREIMDDLKPYHVGGGMINSVKKDSVEYTDTPERFEAGTPNIAGAVGLDAAVEYLEEIGMEEVQRHDQELTRKMMDGLGDIEGISVLSPKGANLVSFTAEYAHPHDVAEVLSQHQVAVRAGHHCAQPLMEKLGINGTVRASPYIYNTEEDVEKFLEAVRKVRATFDV